MRTINTRLVLALVAAILISATVIVGVHALQSQRIASGLLQQAERSEAQARPDLAARFYSRYLEIAPEDNDARARLGRILAARAVGGSIRAQERALFVLEKVLLRDATRGEERRLLIAIALELKRFDLAGEHLKTAHEQAPEDGEVDDLYARWHLAQSRPADAKTWLRHAIEHAPKRLESYLALADLIRRQPTGEKKPVQEADAVIDAMVTANDDQAAAHLARWNYRRAWDAPKTPEAIAEARRDVDRARELDPNSADTLLAVAELTDLKGEAGQAAELLRGAIPRFPEDVRLYRALAGLELRAGRGAQAAACFHDGAQRVSGTARQDLLWAEANLRADLGEADAVPALMDQMRKAGCPRAALDYIDARLLILGGRWSEAAQAFERLRPLLESKPELVENIDLFLAQCYAQLGEPLRQLAACQRALALNPKSVAARQGCVDACVALGRVDEAFDQSSALTKQSNAGEVGWVQMARLSLLRNISQGRKDWREVEQALDQAEKAAPQSTDVVLLRVDLLTAQGRPAEARTSLQKAHEQQPRELRLLTALAEMTDRAGDTAEAQKRFAEAEQVGGDSAILRAARARTLGRRISDETRTQLRKLCENVARFSETERAALLPTLAEESHRVGNLDDARRLWTELAAHPRYRNDVRLRLQLFTMAVRARDDAGMQRLLTELERIEHGRGACWHFCEAQRLLETARQGNLAALDEARGHLDVVAAQRPSWPAVPLARADIERQKENWDAAVAHYHRAIDLGGRTVGVTRELVQTLIRCRRFAEAEAQVRQLQASDLAASGLGRIAAELSLRNQEPALAVKAALEAVSENSADYRDHLWLGQLLASADARDARAEKHLRRAVALAEKSPETWVALVQFLAAAGRKDEAEKTIAEATKRAPEASRSIILAPCCEALGQRADAEKHYRQAAETEKSALAQGELARFYVRNERPVEAEAPLRKIMEREVKATEEESAAARRDLAGLVAADPARFAEALALVSLATDDAGRVVEKTKPTATEWAREQRARARVLARGVLPALREQAVTRLEELGKRQALAAEDRLLLAQLYEARGAFERARDLTRDLLGIDGNNPLYLAYHARLLLRLAQTDAAEKAVEKLEALEKARRLEPNTLQAVELRAQILERRGKSEEVLRLVLPLTKQSKVSAEQLSLAIAAYARQKRFPEALDQCARAWEVCRPEAAARMSVAVLRTGVKDPEQIARVDGWLQAALRKSETPPVDLLLSFADLKDLQEKYVDAETAYRNLLKQDPDHAVALNNLAWLLAARGTDGDEPLRLINRAIERAGPQPAFLDTRAFVQLARHNHDQAREDLEKATRDSPSPTHLLHLARSHTLARDLSAASAALTRAKAAGLDPATLHPLERPTYQKLLEDLPQR